MKLLNVLCVFIILLNSLNCRFTSHVSKNYYLQNYKESCILEFKFVAFRSCLKCGYQNSPAINSILLSDKSYVSDFRLGFENYKLADSIGKAQIPKIIADSIRLNALWIQHLDSIDAAKAKSGNYVLKNCLQLYTSNYLDSIARKKIK